MLTEQCVLMHLIFGNDQAMRLLERIQYSARNERTCKE